MTNIRDRFYELDILLNYLDDRDWLKIPDKIIFYIKENKNLKHTWNYDEGKTFQDQEIHEDTMALFSYLAYKYIANDSEKEEMKKIFDENSHKANKQINFDNIFSQEETAIQTNEAQEQSPSEESLIVLDDNEEISFFKKLSNFLSNFFSKLFK